MMGGMSGLTGRLLVASPLLADDNFRRSVVLLLDHGEDGALGVVVNRPLEVDVEAVLPAWQPYATRPGRLFRGGPVALDSALGVVAVPGDAAVGGGQEHAAPRAAAVDVPRGRRHRPARAGARRAARRAGRPRTVR